MTNTSFTMYAGDTKSFTMPIKHEKTGLPVDLTGCTAVFSMAEYLNPTPEFVFCTVPVEIQYPSKGIIAWAIEPRHTVGKKGTYPFDITVTFADGAVKTAYFGWAEIKPSAKP